MPGCVVLTGANTVQETSCILAWRVEEFRHHVNGEKIRVTFIEKFPNDAAKPTARFDGGSLAISSYLVWPQALGPAPQDQPLVGSARGLRIRVFDGARAQSVQDVPIHEGSHVVTNGDARPQGWSDPERPIVRNDPGAAVDTNVHDEVLC